MGALEERMKSCERDSEEMGGTLKKIGLERRKIYKKYKEIDYSAMG
jgi:hypothetical protein